MSRLYDHVHIGVKDADFEELVVTESEDLGFIVIAETTSHAVFVYSYLAKTCDDLAFVVGACVVLQQPRLTSSSNLVLAWRTMPECQVTRTQFHIFSNVLKVHKIPKTFL
eukprot:sb/3477306/